MTSMGEVTLRINSIFLAGGAMLEEGANSKLNLYQWVGEVFRIASLEFHLDAKKAKENQAVELRRIVTYLACVKFKVITEDRGTVSLNKVGDAIARAEHRETVYDHATMIHAVKRHVMAIKNQNKGYKEYAEKYFQLKTILINRRFISQFELDEKIKYTYTRG